MVGLNRDIPQEMGAKIKKEKKGKIAKIGKKSSDGRQPNCLTNRLFLPIWLTFTPYHCATIGMLDLPVAGIH